MQNKNIIRPVLATAFILSIPFLAMLFNIKVYDPGSGLEKVNWGLADFVIMGALLLTTGIALEFTMKKLNSKHRVIAGIAIVAIFLIIWAELAVGIFGTPWAGS